MNKTDKTAHTGNAAPMSDPNERILKKKPDEQTHSRLVKETDKKTKA